MLVNLESIVLPKQSQEESEQEAHRRHSNSSQKELQSSVSKPLLRLDSTSMALDTDSKSVDSKRESEQITEQLIRLRQQKIYSFGISNDSSYDSFVEEDVLRASSALRSGSKLQGLYRRKEISTERNSEVDGSCSHCINEDDCQQVSASGSDSTRRTVSESTSHSCKGKGKHCGIFRKSISLDAVQILDKLGDLEMNHYDNYQSMQSLVEIGKISEENGLTEIGGGGGDSGIDPGEMDVFKFPQRQESTSSSVGPSDDVGDRTPMYCTSPNPGSAAKSKLHVHISTATHIHKDMSNLINSRIGVLTTPPLSPTSNDTTDNITLTACSEKSGPCEETDAGASRSSPVHCKSNSDSIHHDDSALITSTECSVSPLGRSWSSSDFSFNLPTPSTPWAPPTSPVPPFTRQTSPTSPFYLRYSPYYNYHHHRTHTQRYSQILSDGSHPPCLKKPKPPNRSLSCRHSTGREMVYELGSSMTELRDGFEHMMFPKSVHFMENFQHHKVEDRDDVSLQRMRCSMRGRHSGYEHATTRARSSSSPTSEAYALGPDNENQGSLLEEYGINLKPDLLDIDSPCLSKHYEILQASHSRLSTSTPDLSKATNSSFTL